MVFVGRAPPQRLPDYLDKGTCSGTSWLVVELACLASGTPSKLGNSPLESRERT